jgi:hypothetical protein
LGGRSYHSLQLREFPKFAGFPDYALTQGACFHLARHGGQLRRAPIALRSVHEDLRGAIAPLEGKCAAHITSLFCLGENERGREKYRRLFRSDRGTFRHCPVGALRLLPQPVKSGIT